MGERRREEIGEESSRPGVSEATIRHAWDPMCAAEHSSSVSALSTREPDHCCLKRTRYSG